MAKRGHIFKCLVCLVNPTTASCQGCKKKLCKDCSKLRKREPNKKYDKAKKICRDHDIRLYYDLRDGGISIKPMGRLVQNQPHVNIHELLEGKADKMIYTSYGGVRYYFKGKLLCKECQ